MPPVLTCDEVASTLVDGFFPGRPVDRAPPRARSRLTQLGLLYAADAAITRHLASFLRLTGGREKIPASLPPTAPRRRAGDRAPALLQSDSGALQRRVMKGTPLAARARLPLNHWPSRPTWRPPARVPEGFRIHLAVARGRLRRPARHGRGLRIRRWRDGARLLRCAGIESVVPFAVPGSGAPPDHGPCLALPVRHGRGHLGYPAKKWFGLRWASWRSFASSALGPLRRIALGTEPRRVERRRFPLCRSRSLPFAAADARATSSPWKPFQMPWSPRLAPKPPGKMSQ
jgi:hypothetical protein